MVITHESETVRKEDLREVQDHQEKRQDHGHLREPQAQAETGLIAFFRTSNNTQHEKDPPKSGRILRDETKSHREVKKYGSYSWC